MESWGIVRGMLGLSCGRKAKGERRELKDRNTRVGFDYFFDALLAQSHDLNINKQKGVEQFVLLIHMYKRP